MIAVIGYTAGQIGVVLLVTRKIRYQEPLATLGSFTSRTLLEMRAWRVWL